MIGDKEHGPLLTQEEVNTLPIGTQVIVTWSGGNGPWQYEVVGRHGEHVYVSPGRDSFLNFVGSERYQTHVSLAHNTGQSQDTREG